MANRRTPPRGGRPARNNRPAQRGGAARARQAAEAAAPRPKLTNRAAVLLVVFALLVVSYASSMRAYLHQRAHIEALQAQIADSGNSVRSAQAELARWRDPHYVEQQARRRFGWVLPGETAYQVLDSNGQPLTGVDKLADPSTIAQTTTKPQAWWSKVGASFDAADHPRVLVPKAKPVTTITQHGSSTP